MNYVVVNLDDHSLVFKGYTFRPGVSVEVDGEVIEENWALFNGLVLNLTITLTAVSEIPSGDSEIDSGTDPERLTIAFEVGHDNPIQITHNRGRLPIVQVIDDDHGTVLFDENTEAGYYDQASDAVTTIIHPSSNVTSVYTDAVSGVVVLLF